MTVRNQAVALARRLALNAHTRLNGGRPLPAVEFDLAAEDVQLIEECFAAISDGAGRAPDDLGSPTLDESRLTRFEVIDETGRVLVRRPCKIELSSQDDGRTLKAFVTGGRPETKPGVVKA